LAESLKFCEARRPEAILEDVFASLVLVGSRVANAHPSVGTSEKLGPFCIICFQSHFQPRDFENMPRESTASASCMSAARVTDEPEAQML
jgi:hypothetical protein